MHPTLMKAVRAVRETLTPKPWAGPIAKHILATYSSLRRGLAALAFALPFALVLGGLYLRIPIQHSLSAYFFAFPVDGECISFPLRTLLTGTLCAICVGLYLYKGFSKIENRALNAAAVFGLGVAFVPKGIDQNLLAACPILKPIADGQGIWPYVHGVCAVSMFCSLGFVAWKCADFTLDDLPPEHERMRARFKRIYRIQAGCMFAVGFAALVLENLVHWTYTVLAAEAFGIWVFGWYWWEKTREMQLSESELKALQGTSCASTTGTEKGQQHMLSDMQRSPPAS